MQVASCCFFLQVLDMCAAPGSKTQQLLEALHAGGCDSMPTGFVVANDADFKRCNLLTHQTKRVCSPCLMVTNHSGEQFPEVKRADSDGKVRRAFDDFSVSEHGSYLHIRD